MTQAQQFVSMFLENKKIRASLEDAFDKTISDNKHIIQYDIYPNRRIVFKDDSKLKVNGYELELI